MINLNSDRNQADFERRLKMENNEVLLESYPLQKDMRIRLPKQIITNIPVQIGDMFNIYYDPVKKEIILRLASNVNLPQK